MSEAHRPCLRLVEPSRPSPAPTARGRRWHPAFRSSADRPILYICGDPEGRAVFTRIARRWDDTRLVVTDDGCTGVHVAIKRRPRLVVLDDELPDVNGLALVEHLTRRVLPSDAPVVVLSHDSSAQARARFVWSGADAYLTKPLRVDEIDGAVAHLIDRNQPA